MEENEFITYHHQTRLSSWTHEKLNQQEIQLYKNQWYKYGMGGVCPLIKQLKIKNLAVFKTDVVTILKQIQSISFPKLVTLQIDTNDIESIEGMNRIWLPNLAEFFFGFQLNSFNSRFKESILAKSQLYQFEQSKSNEECNRIKEMKSLCFCNWEKLKAFSLDFLFLLDRSRECCDIAYLAKMKASQIEKLYIAKREEGVMEAFRRKNVKIEIIYERKL